VPGAPPASRNSRATAVSRARPREPRPAPAPSCRRAGRDLDARGPTGPRDRSATPCEPAAEQRCGSARRRRPRAPRTWPGNWVAMRCPGRRSATRVRAIASRRSRSCASRTRGRSRTARDSSTRTIGRPSSWEPAAEHRQAAGVGGSVGGTRRPTAGPARRAPLERGARTEVSDVPSSPWASRARGHRRGPVAVSRPWVDGVVESSRGLAEAAQARLASRRAPPAPARGARPGPAGPPIAATSAARAGRPPIAAARGRSSPPALPPQGGPARPGRPPGAPRPPRVQPPPRGPRPPGRRHRVPLVARRAFAPARASRLGLAPASRASASATAASARARRDSACRRLLVARESAARRSRRARRSRAPRLPGRDRLDLPVRPGAGRHRRRLRGLRQRGEGLRRTVGFRGQAIRLRRVPGRLPGGRLELRAASRSASSVPRRLATAPDSAARARSSAPSASAAASAAAACSRSAASASACSPSTSRTSRSAAARRSRGESPRPIRTVTASRTAPPSRVTASQPPGRDACRARAAWRSGVQTHRASRARAAPFGSRRTASTSRPPPAAASASSSRRSSAVVPPPADRSDGPIRSPTTRCPRSPARAAAAAASTT